MKTYKIISLFILTGITGIFLLKAPLVKANEKQASQQTLNYHAAAYDQKSGEHLYTEFHSETIQNGKTILHKVRYGKNSKEIFAEKNINYSKSQIAPDFNFVDHRRKYQQGAQNLGGQYRLFSKEDDKSPLKSDQIKATSDLVVDSGIDKFVAQNWQQLLQGQKLRFRFAVASQRDYYTFNVQKTGITTVMGQNAMRVKVSIDSRVLSFFAEDVFANYATENDHRLLSYHGIATISDLKGQSYRVNTYFSYPK